MLACLAVSHYKPIFFIMDESVNYLPPELEKIEIEVEVGFETSKDDDGGISAPSWGIL